MPSTPIFAFPYEHPADDQPGVTLHGGDPPSSPILAEAVETELDRVENEVIADILARLAKAETGWRPIASGSVGDGATSLAVDLTQAGVFPAGTFSRIRLALQGNLNAVGHLGLRLNNNQTSIYRRHYRSEDSAGTLIDDDSFTGSAWLVGRWSTAFNCNLRLEMFRTDVSNEVSYQTSAFQQASGNGTTTFGGGKLQANLLPTSIQVFPTNGAASFGTQGVRFWVEGLIDA